MALPRGSGSALQALNNNDPQIVVNCFPNVTHAAQTHHRFDDDVNSAGKVTHWT